MKCYITVRDEVFCTISGVRPSDMEALEKKYAVYVDGYFFMPAFKLGRWDGKKRFFEKTGKTYIRFLPDIVMFLAEQGYEIELVDHRNPVENPSGRSHADQFADRNITLRPIS